MTRQKLGAFFYRGCSDDLRRKVEATWLRWARTTNMSPVAILSELNRWRTQRKPLYVDLEEIAEINGKNGGVTR